MSTSTSPSPFRLTLGDLDFLSSLNDSELTDLLTRLPKSTATVILRRLDVHIAKEACRANLRKYCPHTPWPKQLAALDLDCLEILYGGAAGPGKSDWLLMGALEWVHVPNYSALLLRKDYARLSLSGGLIPRSHLWLTNTDAKWNGTDKRWTFPSGATISFGYLQTSTDVFRYGSSEYQFIGWDESAEFTADPYTFLFSRLRKTVDNPAPRRMRAATNPGGVGHTFFKNRFMDDAALAAMAAGEDGIFWKDGRAFVPGRIRDNPALNEAEYREALSHIADPVTRERLLAGDWSVTEQGLIQAGWLRFYVPHGENYRMWHQDRIAGVVPWRECELFQIVDCAGSSEDISREAQGREASWSVISTFRYHRKTGNLFWVDLRRGRWVFPDLVEQVRQAHAEDGPAWIGIEDEKTGRAVLQTLRGLPTRALSHESKDKVTRAATALNELEAGRIWLPHEAKWRGLLLDRLLLWTGNRNEPADEIDTLAYAAREVMAPGRAGKIIWQGC